MTPKKPLEHLQQVRKLIKKEIWGVLDEISGPESILNPCTRAPCIPRGPYIDTCIANKQSSRGLNLDTRKSIHDRIYDVRTGEVSFHRNTREMCPVGSNGVWISVYTEDNVETGLLEAQTHTARTGKQVYSQWTYLLVGEVPQSFQTDRTGMVLKF